jgi:putative two-component system response regulator
MIPADCVRTESSAMDLIRALEPRLAQLRRDELGKMISPLVGRLEEGLPPADVAEVVDAALAICRRLYAGARSGDALPLARAALVQSTVAGQPALMRRAATACGLLAADTADLVAAIEHHVQALRLASHDGDRIEMSRTWNNLGLAMGITGNYEMAARCYQRSLALVESQPAPVYSRYAACGNLADSYYQLGDLREGLRLGEKALQELTPAFREQDLYGAILLRRNLVRLLVASGRPADAADHVAEAAALAERARTPRALIAAATTRAAHDLASGRFDLALTRLEQALSRAREVPATLRDTLACVIRAEEAAGNAERALLRLEELSQHVYRFAVERAREHVELAGLSGAGNGSAHRQAQAKARLVSKIAPPAQPDGWKALQRLGVSAAMRMDASGWHGMRVGALTKALAMASGCGPLQALEMGLAAELHDVGMMSIPEGILSKRGALNDAERAIVQRHVDAGAEILRDDRHPRILLAREIARYHHARWDGHGYPDGVGGSRIPLPARLCAVADAYDAMVCGLGGRAPRAMNEALDELRRQAGRQFDPELVGRFDALIRAETADRGLDLAASAGMEGFQELVLSLQQDRGFV